MNQNLKTREQVKREFEANGNPVSDWAAQHGFAPSDVYRVLNGYSPCKRGKPHQIAVLLGIKAKVA